MQLARVAALCVMLCPVATAAQRPAARDPAKSPRDVEVAPKDYSAHVAALQERLPGDGFTIVVEPPFVVVGDEASGTVKRRAASTVKWAVDLLKQDFFTKDPDGILDIWLFKDKESYETHTKLLFGESPTTPFGYYSRTHRAIVMNIATGGGTLVHEIVHPFMEANFPSCPAWFNEGLASLYEQCGEKNGHIHGQTNWRLAGLQQAIKAGKLPSFRALTATSASEFYGDDRGTNYSQARYLCYALQERGLLVKFYREFHANRKDDPTGYRTLERVLGEPDMKAFQQTWEDGVLRLTFP